MIGHPSRIRVFFQAVEIQQVCALARQTALVVRNAGWRAAPFLTESGRNRSVFADGEVSICPMQTR